MKGMIFVGLRRNRDDIGTLRRPNWGGPVRVEASLNRLMRSILTLADHASMAAECGLNNRDGGIARFVTGMEKTFLLGTEIRGFSNRPTASALNNGWPVQNKALRPRRRGGSPPPTNPAARAEGRRSLGDSHEQVEIADDRVWPHHLVVLVREDMAVPHVIYPFV